MSDTSSSVDSSTDFETLDSEINNEIVSDEAFDKILDEEITPEVFYINNFSKEQLLNILYHGRFNENWDDFVVQESFNEFTLDDLVVVVIEYCPKDDDFWDHPHVVNNFTESPSVLTEFLETHPDPDLLERFENCEFYGGREELEKDPSFQEIIKVIRE